ncbi:MAG TPA: N-acetylmuramoyl-L-alanine amidase [Trueperaceae bacterium]|nr:N-acetylmuramoyl-L-alanine amidase [Trueperaceae bacterium]
MRRSASRRRSERPAKREAGDPDRVGGDAQASAAQRFYDPASVQGTLGTVATLDDVPRARGRDQRPRRRKALFLTFLALLALLVGLNGALALRDAFTVGGTVPRLVPSGATGVLGLFNADVRVLRFSVLRRAANAIKGPVRIGLQVGHLGAADQPDELATLRTSTGGHWDGVDEVTINLAVVEALAERLTVLGFEVDVLNATIPVAYRADALISVHADANPDTQRRGYKSAHTRPARNALEPLLKLAIDRSVFLATELPDDDRNVSGNMLQYYAFNHRRFTHSAAARTPALLVELGYLSNEQDMKLLRDPSLFADAIARGLVAFLDEIGRL